MKARHKDTVEIIELAEQGIVSHDGRRFCWYQVELIPEPIDEFAPSLLNPTVDWPSFRREASKDILCAIVSHTGGNANIERAVELADELIRQLKQE